MMPADETASSELPAEWNGLFLRVGAELRTLAGAVGDLQDFLTPLVGDVVERDPDAMARLQDLDVVKQSLHALSEFVGSLDTSAVLTDAKALSSGMEAICLSDLAQRLSPRRPRLIEPSSPTSTLELF